jgi:uncharacterized membrane protein YphA (DoxX/SURF4 family)
MAESTIERGTATAPATSQKRSTVIALWVLRVVLAVAFVSAGAQKLAGTHYMVTMFDKIDAGQWLRYVVGLLEVAGAIALLVPALCGLSAVCLTLLMVGATITNVVISYNVAVPVVFGVIAVIVAIGCRSSLTALLGRVRR